MKKKKDTGRKEGRLAWIDLEMTGLFPETDEIIEMAIIVTDSNLEIVSEAKGWVFSCSEEKLDAMDAWNTSTHTASGLVDKVRASTLDYDTGEREALGFLRGLVLAKDSPMCGNTICQDRRFLARHMPRLHDFFHYRNLDVSSFKIACNLWVPNMPAMPQKDSDHRALSDIRQSIDEMRAYRDFLFKQ